MVPVTVCSRWATTGLGVEGERNGTCREVQSREVAPDVLQQKVWTTLWKNAPNRRRATNVIRLIQRFAPSPGQDGMVRG